MSACLSFKHLFLLLGIINYKIQYSGLEDNETDVICIVEVYDQSGTFILNNMADADFSGTLHIPQAKLWWPYLMDEHPGYMYTLKVNHHKNSTCSLPFNFIHLLSSPR